MVDQELKTLSLVGLVVVVKCLSFCVLKLTMRFRCTVQNRICQSILLSSLNLNQSTTSTGTIMVQFSILKHDFSFVLVVSLVKGIWVDTSAIATLDMISRGML